MHHISINLSGQKWACVTFSIRNDVASCLLWVSWYVDFLRAYFVRTLGKFCLGIASGLFGWEPETLLTCMVQSKVAWCVCLLTMLLSCHLWYLLSTYKWQLGLLPSKRDSDQLCAERVKHKNRVYYCYELLLGLFVLERIKCQKKKKEKLMQTCYIVNK